MESKINVNCEWNKNIVKWDDLFLLHWHYHDNAAEPATTNVWYQLLLLHALIITWSYHKKFTIHKLWFIVIFIYYLKNWKFVKTCLLHINQRYSRILHDFEFHDNYDYEKIFLCSLLLQKLQLKVWILSQLFH